MKLIERSLDHLRCPRCFAESLGASDLELRCAGCDSRYPIADGIVDFYPDYGHAQDRAQKAMESRLLVSIYENHWRPWFTWLASPVTYAEEKDWLLAQHDPGSVDCALDVGSGTGRYARLLADAYRPNLVIALDLSMPMVVRGSRVARQQGYDDILFLRGDAQCLPVRDGAVDLLNCFGALHLFPDPARAIAEMARSARPSTLFTCFAAGKLEAPPTTLRQKLFTRLASFHLFEVDELRAQLTAAGFEDFRCTQRGWVLLFSARKARGG